MILGVTYGTVERVNAYNVYIDEAATIPIDKYWLVTFYRRRFWLFKRLFTRRFEDEFEARVWASSKLHATIEFIDETCCW